MTMSNQSPDWLRQGDTDPEAIAEAYDQWAGSYDDDLAQWSYQAPGRVAEMLASSGVATPGPVLDVGCGTGLVGRELHRVGFTDLVGVDLSPKSLEVAGATGLYRSLHQVDLQSERLPFDDATFAAVVCVGVMTYLPDTAATVTELCRVARTGAPVIFTQREDVFADRADQATLQALTDAGTGTIEAISDPLPYLPDSDEMGDIPARFIHLQAG